MPSCSIHPVLTHSPILLSIMSRTVSTSSGWRLKFSVESHHSVTRGILSSAHQARTSSALAAPRAYPVEFERPASRACRRWPSWISPKMLGQRVPKDIGQKPTLVEPVEQCFQQVIDPVALDRWVVSEPGDTRIDPHGSTKSLTTFLSVTVVYRLCLVA